MHSVSINVASKAVNLLKAQKLVAVQVGDGIYSTCDGDEKSRICKFSGERLFGIYGKSKILRILVEDYLDSQWLFWTKFFQEFVSENIDIELEVHREPAEGIAPADYYDIALGGISFLQNNGFTANQLYDRSVFTELGGKILSETLVNPSRLAGRSGEYYIPYGAAGTKLFSDRPIPPPVPGESSLDYAERLAAENHGSYAMLRGLAFLESTGISFLDETGCRFRMPERKLFLEIFHRMRTLYEAGNLIWFHGRCSDFRKLWPFSGGKQIMVAEIPSNTMDVDRKKLHAVFLPEKKAHHLIFLCAAVCLHSSFPEECLRIVSSLLDSRNQRALMDNNHVYPVIPGVSPETDVLFSQLAFSFDNVPDQTVNRALYEIVEWELMHFLLGRRKDEIYDLISAKMEYYFRRKADIENANTQAQKGK